MRGYPLHSNNVAGKKDITAEGPTGGQKTRRRREGINNTLVPSKYDPRDGFGALGQRRILAPGEAVYNIMA